MIVILTGAGLSAESGLGTFRDEGGIWARFDLEDVATPGGFARDPVQVHEFYNLRRRTCLDAVPNAGHVALARLKDALGDGVLIVTQNVDDLHERAGARDVIHMHGTLLGGLCAACDARWPAPEVMAADDPCPVCAAPATRPDVVWFGEMPYRTERIGAALDRATLFAAIGTSGNVWPAAGFVEQARAAGADTVEINLEPTAGAARFDRQMIGAASVVVPEFVAEILGQ